MQKLDWNNHIPAVTTCLVVNETYTLLNYRSKGRRDLLIKLDELFWGEDNFFRIIYLGDSDYREIAQLLNKYTSSQKTLSFVDASLIYVSQILKYEEIISFDAHFDGILTRVSV